MIDILSQIIRNLNLAFVLNLRRYQRDLVTVKSKLKALWYNELTDLYLWWEQGILLVAL